MSVLGAVCFKGPSYFYCKKSYVFPNYVILRTWIVESPIDNYKNINIILVCLYS